MTAVQMVALTSQSTPICVSSASTPRTTANCIQLERDPRVSMAHTSGGILASARSAIRLFEFRPNGPTIVFTRDSLTIAAGGCEGPSERSKNRPACRRAPIVEKKPRMTTCESAGWTLAYRPPSPYSVKQSRRVRGCSGLAVRHPRRRGE
jgi:hypothetical protein